VPISALTALPAWSGSFFALAASYNKVHAYSVDYGTSLGSFEGHADLISAMSWGGSGSNGLLYTASHDTTVKAWHAPSDQAPWITGSPPFLELATPDGSVPRCLQVFSFMHISGAVSHLESVPVPDLVNARGDE
jgi:WD40 repeat protein